MNALELVDRCVAAGIEEVFRELGFVRDGLEFRRTVGGVLNVAEVQVRDEESIGSARFAVNLGAHHRQVEKILGEPPLERPSVGCCTVETRVNRGVSGYDDWWKVTRRHEALVGGRVATKLRQSVEPWFTMANDLATLNELVEDKHDFWCLDQLVPAAIALALGQFERGRARLDEVEGWIHAWRQHRLERFRKNDPFGTLVLARAHFMRTGKRTKRFEYNQFEWDQLR